MTKLLTGIMLEPKFSNYWQTYFKYYKAEEVVLKIIKIIKCRR